MSEAEPIVPASAITRPAPEVIKAPDVIPAEVVNSPAELSDIVSAAAAEAAVLKDSLVALLLALKSPSDTASIPAATNIASPEPVPSSGA